MIFSHLQMYIVFLFFFTGDRKTKVTPSTSLLQLPLSGGSWLTGQSPIYFEEKGKCNSQKITRDPLLVSLHRERDEKLITELL